MNETEMHASTQTLKPSPSAKEREADCSNIFTVSEHELLHAYAAGNEGAFEILFERYFRLVYAIALRQTGDSHLSKDITQSVFLTLSRKARGFSAKVPVVGWLVRTTAFVCRDAIKLRRRREQNERMLAADLRDRFESNGVPDKAETLLHEALETLRPDEHATIIVRFYEGRDFEEIARMFCISAQAARKRTSRCVAKLQSFMRKRGMNIALPALGDLLSLQSASYVTSKLIQEGRAWKGIAVSEDIASLSERTLRLLRRRSLARRIAESAAALCLIFLVIWSVQILTRSASVRLEKLGGAWGALDQRIARHRQFLIQTPPTAPNYQATVQKELDAISRESSRIIAAVGPLLVSPNERTKFAIFLTGALSEPLNLTPSQRVNLQRYIESRLSRGANLQDAMKIVAESAQTETSDIKGMLSPSQQQIFDQIYGADGVLLFSYPKALALKAIGP